MTNWTRVSNFFMDIRLERPDAVLIDEASRQLRDLYDHTDNGMEHSFFAFAEGLNLPQYDEKGVLVYDQEVDEPAFFQDFSQVDLDEDEREQVYELLPEKMQSEELSIGVDAYNGFDVLVPSRDYCQTTNFSRFEDILGSRYRFD